MGYSKKVYQRIPTLNYSVLNSLVLLQCSMGTTFVLSSLKIVSFYLSTHVREDRLCFLSF